MAGSCGLCVWKRRGALYGGALLLGLSTMVFAQKVFAQAGGSQAGDARTPGVTVPSAVSPAEVPSVSVPATPIPEADGGTVAAPAQEAAPAQRRTELNLMGQTDAKSGESRRNENVQFNPIDNNALKELNIRLGTTPTAVEEFKPQFNYFSAEYGNPPVGSIHLPGSSARGFHGRLNYGHLNSILSARAFFQVGGVKPARENEWGVNTTTNLWKGATFTFNGNQQKIRGNVNGNVLVPRADERTPLTRDPALGAYVSRVLGAYPAENPNRTDINERMLNTNSPQAINNNTIGGTVNQQLGENDKLVLDYLFIGQQVDAFQLVQGQNPNTTTRAHRARVSWNRSWSPRTVTNFTLGFDRAGIVILPDDEWLGVSIFPSSVLDNILGNTVVPINRAQNDFKYAGQWQHNTGKHSFTAGFLAVRRQLNGEESDTALGAFSFFNNYGNDAITNVRLGLPSTYFRSVGEVNRGFRNWDMAYYFGDKWNASQRLTINLGVRWRPITRPAEVNNRNTLNYDSDWNNVGPMVGLAYRLPERWGVFRAGYTIQFGEIFPVTYQQIRLNAPLNYKLIINDPDFLDPLRSFNVANLANTPSVWYDIDPDLATPYSGQYNAAWEFEPKVRWRAQFAYIGSRSPKLLQHWYFNRAYPVEGIPLTTGTINARRPRQDILDIRRVQNGSFAWFDAFKASLTVPNWQGLSLETSYWFSKALDLGSDYNNTAYDTDSFRTRAQWEQDIFAEQKSRSRFDQPHSFLLRANYDTPRLQGFARHLFSNWSLSTVALAKNGTPFNVQSGSDAPGFGNVDGTNSDRPNLIDPSVLGRTASHPDTTRDWMRSSAFAYFDVRQGELRGNLGRNAFRKGPIRNVNASLSRSFPLQNDMQLRFRAESINFLNTPQFDAPGFRLTDPNFGYITNTLNDGRTFRFQMSLIF
jgi:hypothetical protein